MVIDVIYVISGFGYFSATEMISLMLLIWFFGVYACYGSACFHVVLGYCQLFYKKLMSFQKISGVLLEVAMIHMAFFLLIQFIILHLDSRCIGKE